MDANDNLGTRIDGIPTDRIPSASPPANSVWKTDGSNTPGWRLDVDTTIDVENSLNSDSTTAALSAKQGMVLRDLARSANTEVYTTALGSNNTITIEHIAGGFGVPDEPYGGNIMIFRVPTGYVDNATTIAWGTTNISGNLTDEDGNNLSSNHGLFSAGEVIAINTTRPSLGLVVFRFVANLEKTRLNDTLTSTSTVQGLTANQGKVLDEKITTVDGRVDTLTPEYYNATLGSNFGAQDIVIGNQTDGTAIPSSPTVNKEFTIIIPDGFGSAEQGSDALIRWDGVAQGIRPNLVVTTGLLKNKNDIFEAGDTVTFIFDSNALYRVVSVVKPLSDAIIGDKAFSNPPDDLTEAEQRSVRTAIGAGSGTGGDENVQADWDNNTTTSDAFIRNKPTDAEFGDKAFSNPPTDLTDTEKQAVRTAIGSGSASGGEENVQSDWNETDTSSDAFIRNKPDVGEDNVNADWNETDTGSDAYIENKPTIPSVPTDSEIGDKAFSNPPTDLTDDEKEAVRNAVDLSDDEIGTTAFTHAPTTLTDTQKTAVRNAIGAGTGGGGGGGEENVQADWDETDTSDDSYIQNKPTIPSVPTDTEIGDKAFSNPPNDLTDAEKTAARTAIGAGDGSGSGEENVQADWNETDTSEDSYIENKPALNGLFVGDWQRLTAYTKGDIVFSTGQFFVAKVDIGNTLINAPTNDPDRWTQTSFAIANVSELPTIYHR